MSSRSTSDSALPRCWPTSDPLYVAYHDEEWGRPVTDERGLYERLCLEGFQSGLSWLTILRKRENFRRAFADFDPDAVARFTERRVERLLGDAGIVRHRGKIEATIANARGVLALRKAGTPLHELVWSFAPADYAQPRTTADWQAQTPESKELSKRLKAAGFRFVGPTTVWAAMQACGVVNDHLATCWVRDEVERRSGLEQPLQPLEVLPELLLGAARHDPGREAGQQAGVALAGDAQPRPAAARLELVPDAERHGAVSARSVKSARPLLVLDLERRLELAPEHVARLVDVRALAASGVDAGLPARQIRHVREVVEHLLGRPRDLDRHLGVHARRIKPATLLEVRRGLLALAVAVAVKPRRGARSARRERRAQPPRCRRPGTTSRRSSRRSARAATSSAASRPSRSRRRSPPRGTRRRSSGGRRTGRCRRGCPGPTRLPLLGSSRRLLTAGREVPDRGVGARRREARQRQVGEAARRHRDRAGTTLTLTPSHAYTPRVISGSTDDYHCMLLDPKLTQNMFVTSAVVKPQRTELVHHVILFEADGRQRGRGARASTRRPAARAGRASAGRS